MKGSRVTIDPAGMSALQEAVDAGLKSLGKTIVSEARGNVRKDTGDLADSIEARVEDGVLTVTAGSGLPDDRAIFNEIGTAEVPAQPYLRPAVYKPRSAL